MERYAPQVVTNLSLDFTLPDTVDNLGKLNHRAAPEVPFITYPDGRPCFFGNLYILWLYDQNYSIADTGGSLTEFANEMALLLRYVSDSQIDILSMTDHRFKSFANWLRARRYRGKKTGVRRTNRVLLFTLDFLSFVGTTVGQPEFVSPLGVIKAERITKVSKRRSNGSPVLIHTWSHPCIVVDDGKSRTGHAIGDETLEKLKIQIDQIKGSFVKRRTEILVKLLEYTGGRRSEAGNFLVSNLRKALASGELQPLIEMQSRKGVRGATREIPVDRHVLEDILDFVDTERRMLLHAKKISEFSSDMLFISERTGRPLSIKYITTTFDTLRKKAGIIEKAHPHQLRHMFISKIFEKRVLEAIGASSSPLRSLDTIMAAVVWEVMQVSGHKDPASLNTYVKTIKKKLFNMLIERASTAKTPVPPINASMDHLSKAVEGLSKEELKAFYKSRLDALEDDESD